MEAIFFHFFLVAILFNFIYFENVCFHTLAHILSILSRKHSETQNGQILARIRLDRF
jgi:hypothetical protein